MALALCEAQNLFYIKKPIVYSNVFKEIVYTLFVCGL
jgi:hypothetical protein